MDIEFDIFRGLRLLAKSDKYQSLFSLFKEGGLSLFENKSNYTNNQVHFLNYLNFYNTIYTDLYLKEVSELVTEDFIYEDAYMYYKRKTKDKKETEEGHKNAKESVSAPSSSNSSKTNTTWVFKKPKKG